jgi:hypothetical protein
VLELGLDERGMTKGGIVSKNVVCLSGRKKRIV